MKGQPQHARRPSTKTVQQSKWKNGVGIPPSSRPESENVIGFDALIATIHPQCLVPRILADSQ